MAEEESPPDLPLRPITKTEFRELTLASKISVLKTEAYRLDENVFPFALEALAEAIDRVPVVINRVLEDHFDE